MHIFFSGIGGTGIGPLALIAKEAGYEVSGSDKQDSQYIEYLRKHGITDIHIGQDEASIAAAHQAKPIDWFVYSSALAKENPHHPELVFVEQQGIKHSKRDELLNRILSEKHLKLIAIAGTHGKTTTTAMVIWLFKELNLPISYSVGAKISFGDMGQYDQASEYFVYECDEFDRNFLAYHPYISLLSGVTWDHHEVFPSREDYVQAFNDFVNQSERVVLWQRELEYLGLSPADKLLVADADGNDNSASITLPGLFTRQDAWLAIMAMHELTKEPVERLTQIINEFPGTARRMEAIAPNLYSDYAHTPEKIVGGMSVAMEMAKAKNQKVVVVYEPLTNRRMHYMAAQHTNVFNGASKLYWVPSYLAREDPNQPVLTPVELIKNLNADMQAKAKPMELDDQLQAVIRSHLDAGDMVVCFTGGGGHSLDEWIRERFGSH